MPRIKGSISANKQSLNRAIQTQTRIAGQVTLRLATIQAANIQRRMDKGLDINDSPMPPYSESYATWRAKQGRQTNYRDLHLKGAMRRDIHAVQTGPTSARVMFGSAREKEKALRHQERAPFFGISGRDQQDLDAELKAIQQELK